MQSAMSRGQGIVEMFTALAGPALGWQIQEGQFRLVYPAGKESGHGSSQAARRVREEQARSLGGYFSFDLAREQLGETSLERPLAVDGAPLPFNGFAADFVYRSISIPDLTVDQIVRLGVRHARRAVEQVAGFAPVRGVGDDRHHSSGK
ncbi:hypothetical protein DN069_19130 [Streptacidiphilus pinicola]|uniref:Uncharacterized protein n=1 Tax=Streptacidiphilus pinicola TaxID=2219663 RepID=A0A2X0KAA5_9ACTN|nr:hypothetical protein [Streptacidiphilus pinicola]RAG84020.1 hypothetical protein DN069_19130 [Streptacidiphilus pinicola]